MRLHVNVRRHFAIPVSQNLPRVVSLQAEFGRVVGPPFHAPLSRSEQKQNENGIWYGARAVPARSLFVVGAIDFAFAIVTRRNERTLKNRSDILPSLQPGQGPAILSIATMNPLAANASAMLSALMHWRGEMVERGLVIASSGVDRLSLRHVGDGPIGRKMRHEVAAERIGDRTEFKRVARIRGFDFHSLVWERLVGAVWRTHLSITAAKFQSTSDFTRWVADIHDLDATTGIAIMKVGEAMQPRGSRVVHFEYSWRSWNMETNRQVAVLERCNPPMQPYSGVEGA